MVPFEGKATCAETCLACGGVKWTGAKCALCELKLAAAEIEQLTAAMRVMRTWAVTLSGDYVYDMKCIADRIDRTLKGTHHG